MTGLAACSKSGVESILPPDACRRCSTFRCCRRQTKQPVPAASPRFTLSESGAELMQLLLLVLRGHFPIQPRPRPHRVSESTQNPVLATGPHAEVSSALRPRWRLRASLHVPSLLWPILLPFSTLFPVTNLLCRVCGKQLEGFHACSVFLLLYPPSAGLDLFKTPLLFLFFFFSVQLPTISAFWLTQGLKSVFPLPWCFLLQ